MAVSFFKRFSEKRAASSAEVLHAIIGSDNVTPATAMQIPGIARCVNMVAGAAAMLPVRLYRKRGGNVEEVKDDPRLAMLNSTTGDSLNADQMRYMWVKDFLLSGAAYGVIERSYGVPARIYYVPPDSVSVFARREDIVHKHFVYNIQGRDYYPYQMLKILRNSDGFGGGKGIVEENPLIISTAYNMLKFQKTQLARGGNKKGFLRTEKTVSKEVMDEIRNKWAELYSNNENSDRVMLLNNGIDFKELSSTSVEMQLNENMATVNNEIMKLFGTKDGELSEETVKNSVMPLLDVMEAAFDSDLLLEEEKGEYYFAFDTRELTRGDIGQRYSAYAVALQNNIMQLDEVRALEDLPKLDLNFIKLGLQDVLLDPKTMMLYTPNTNSFQKFGEQEVKQESESPEPDSLRAEYPENMEMRFNHNHDDKGRFASGGGGYSGSDSVTYAIKSKNTLLNYGKVSQQKQISKGLQKEFDEEYKHFTELFGEMDTVTSVENMEYRNNGIYGAYNPQSGVITMYGVGGEGYNHYMQQLAAKLHKEGQWSTGHPMHSFRHELAHAYQEHLRKNDPKFQEKMEQLKEFRNNILSNLTSQAKSDNIDIKKLKIKKLSLYGLAQGEGIDEFISECIAEYINGKPRDTSVEVVNILKG